MSVALDPRLVAMLVCPVSRGPLSYLPGRQLLVSNVAGLAYPIRDGVAVMLPEEAIVWPVGSGPNEPHTRA